MLRQMVEEHGLGARVELLGEVAAADVLPHPIAVHVISLRQTHRPPWQPNMRGCIWRRARACQTLSASCSRGMPRSCRVELEHGLLLRRYSVVRL